MGVFIGEDEEKLIAMLIVAESNRLKGELAGKCHLEAIAVDEDFQMGWGIESLLIKWGLG